MLLFFHPRAPLLGSGSPPVLNTTNVNTAYQYADGLYEVIRKLLVSYADTLGEAVGSERRYASRDSIVEMIRKILRITTQDTGPFRYRRGDNHKTCLKNWLQWECDDQGLIGTRFNYQTQDSERDILRKLLQLFTQDGSTPLLEYYYADSIIVIWRKLLMIESGGPAGGGGGLVLDQGNHLLAEAGVIIVTGDGAHIVWS